MNVIEVTEKDQWNTFIAQSHFGDILQTWEWGEIKKGELWTPYRIQVQDSGHVVGQALVLQRKLPMGLGLFYMPRGPVLDYAASNAREVLQLILDWTKNLAQQHNGLMIKIGPAVTRYQAIGIEDMLIQMGLKPASHSIQMKHTWKVDLRPDEADILKKLDKDTRNLIRRAAKEGVVVDRYDQVDDVKALRIFHNMYLTTAKRGSFPARPWSQMVRLWEEMAPVGMAYVYTASFEKDALASSVVLQVGKTAYQLWAGSRRDVGKKYPTYALQWSIMTDMKQKGVEFYDMWGAAPTDDPGSHPWSGPSMFKKGFGGQRLEFIGDYDLPVSRYYSLFTMADSLRQKILARGI